MRTFRSFPAALGSLILVALVAVASSTPTLAQYVELCSRQSPGERVSGELLEYTQGRWTVLEKGRRTTVYKDDYEPCPRAENPALPPRPAPPAPPPLRIAPAEQVETLTLTGSGTVGRGLMPALIAAFARSAGAELARDPTADGNKFDAYDIKRAGDGRTILRIVLNLTGSRTAIDALVSGKADVGMSSERVGDEQIRRLTALRGGGERADFERVVALDAIAVIVAASNPAADITLCQAARIFAGKSRDWSDVKGAHAGPIRVHTVTEMSGTFNVMEDFLMEQCGERISLSLIRHATQRELREAVARDSQAIGFIGYSELTSEVRALAIRGDCGLNSVPSRFTIKTEDYPLTRRLYLYVSKELGRNVQSFIDFVLSDAAQQAIAGYAGLDLGIQAIDGAESPSGRETGPAAAEDDRVAAQQFRRDMAGARRLSITYRFEFNSSVLDSKALQDIARLARRYQRGGGGGETTIILAGFADAVDTAEYNRTLSLERAKTVRQALLNTGAALGNVTILAAGYGEIRPVACNALDHGREKNRRVEVWVR